MVLCDIGNTNLHFCYYGTIWNESPNAQRPKKPEVTIYYISVNENHTQKLLKSHKNCVNLAPYFKLDSVYKGLGIDRIAAISAMDNGVIVDAGSAITIDVVRNHTHLGGVIMPGISSYNKFYKIISHALSTGLNMGVDLNAIPQDTRSAISYGTLKSIILTISDLAKDQKIVFTGGDGQYLSRFFSNSVYDATLVFKGMDACVKRHNLHKGKQ